MNNKRIKEIDVNLDALKDVKNITELKKEPGRIFGHLSQSEENAAYDELGAALGIIKPTAQSQPAASAQ
jgi:hypothetical protein